MQEKQGAMPGNADLSVQQCTQNHHPGAQQALAFRVVIEASYIGWLCSAFRLTDTP